MAEPACTRLTLRLPDRAAGWWELPKLRSLFAAEAHPLGYFARPGELGFLAVNETQAQRSVVVLEQAAVAFDLPLCSGKLEWHGPTGAVALPLECHALLHASAPPGEVEKLETIDLAGLRLGGWVMLFRTEPTMARDAVHYRVEGSGELKHLITGLAPGNWQIWRDGWLEDPGIEVDPRAGALYFVGEPGGYFLRRR